MRRWSVVRWLIGVSIAIAAGSAQATPVVDLIFTATTGAGTTGASSITAASGDVLTLEIRLTADAAGISSYGISIEFDSDYADELDLGTITEALPVGFDFNITSGVDSSQESSGAQAGNVLTFEAVAFGLGPVSSTFVIGTVEFSVTANVASDGIDVTSGLFNTFVDGVFDNDGADLSESVVFGGASVVPEPGSAYLLGVGIAAVGAVLRRRKMRSIA